jgi:cytochrome P450
MESNAASLLAKATPRKIVRWIGDRARHAIAHGRWHASRLRMQWYDALKRHPPLPPGSLSGRAVHDAVTDDRHYLKLFRRPGPIFKLFWGSRRVKICVVGLPLGRRILNENRGALRLMNIQDITPVVPAEYLRSMNPEIHPKYRRIFLGAFHANLVAPSECALRDLLQSELAGLSRPAVPAQPPARRLYATLDRLAIRSLLLTMLGVGPKSEAAATLEALYHRLGPGNYPVPVGPEQVAAFREIRGVIEELRRGIERDPQTAADSVLRRLIQTMPSALDETVFGNLLYMVERGRHDLRGLLRWIVKYLSDHPAVVEELRASLAVPGDASRLAEACVHETLRLDQAEQLNRKIVRSFSFEGFHFPKDHWLCILTRESHQNAEVFAEPEAFCPHRFLERHYSNDEYGPFGIDEHQCIAASFVVSFSALFIEELVQGFTWTVTADGRRCMDLHWEPATEFAVSLEPRNPGHRAHPGSQGESAGM